MDLLLGLLGLLIIATPIGCWWAAKGLCELQDSLDELSDELNKR